MSVTESGLNVSVMQTTPDVVDPFVSPVIDIIIQVLFIIIAAAGTLGNTLVIIVNIFNKEINNTTNVLVTNLAVADLMFLLTTAFMSIFSMACEGGWCQFRIQFMIYSFHATACGSVYLMVLMAVDRYLAIVHPMASKSYRTVSNTKIVITALWIIILSACIPVIYFFQSIRDWSIYVYIIPLTSMGYAVPLAIICILYCLIYRKIQAVGKNAPTDSSTCRKRKVLRMLIAVVMVFATCWAPFHIMFILGTHAVGNKTMFIVIGIITPILAMLNSCINPVLYAFLSENYRKEFRKIAVHILARLQAGSNNIRSRCCSMRTESSQVPAGELEVDTIDTAV